LRETIEPLFYGLVKFLKEVGEIAFKRAFIDGTKIEANANKYTAVWRKNLNRYEKWQHEKVEEARTFILERYQEAIAYDPEAPEEGIGKMVGYLEERSAKGGSGGRERRRGGSITGRGWKKL
jgi:hypothetical protein